MPFKMKGTAMYDKIKNDRGVSSMRLKSPMDKSPLEHENPPGVLHNDRQPNPGNPAGQFNPSHQHTGGEGSKLGQGKDGKTLSPLGKSPMDKSPMDSAHDRAVKGMGPNRAFIKKDSAMDKSPMDHAHGAMNMSHMKLKEDSAMDMSHMKLTQDAAMKLTSAMKKMSPMQANAFIGAKMAAEKAGKSTFEVDGKTYNVR